jgi:hypothetical protein
MLMSFRILLHAEIEYYLEQLIIQKVNKAKEKWIKHKDCSSILLSLLSYTECSFSPIPTALGEINTGNDITFRVNKAVSTFITRIEKQNHGIKEANIIPLVISLGMDYTKIDQTLLNDLSSFGGLRGDIAHKSFKVAQSIIPKNEENLSQQIIQSLKPFDELIWSL